MTDYFKYLVLVPSLEKQMGTPGVHVSSARKPEMRYSLCTSVCDVPKLNVANVVRFSLYIFLDIFYCRYFFDNCEKVELVVKRRALPYITNEGPSDKNIFTEVGIEYQRQCEKIL